MGHSHIKFRGGNSLVDFFSFECTDDDVGNVELDGDEMVMLIVGGSEESFRSEVSTFLLDEIFCAAFAVAIVFLLGLPIFLC